MNSSGGKPARPYSSRLLQGAVVLLARLPLSVLHGLGGLIGRLVYALPGRYRRRLQANARQAGYPEAAFARRAAAHTGAMILETPKIWLREAECLRLTSSHDTDVLHEVQAEGRGVLFLTPHLGCFEITPRHILSCGQGPMTVMYRPPRLAALAPLMTHVRNSSSLTAVPANRQGLRAFVRALRQGESIGLLPDQVPSDGEGLWLPFFDRPAFTMTLAARLALQTGVAVILTAGERLPGGRGWRIHYLRLPEPLPADVPALTAAINQAMEELIRRFPEQYLWSYHRYKAPADAPAPPPSNSSTLP